MKYDIAYLENGNAFVRANRKIITSTTLEGRRSQITKFFNTLLSQNKTLEIPTIDGDVLTITRDITGDKARDNYKNIKGNRVKLTDDEFLVKLNVETHIDEIAETSRGNKKTSVPDAKNHDFAKDGFTYRKAYFEDFDGQYYEITLSVGHNGTVATVYNVGKIEKSVLPSAKIIAGAGSKALGKTLSKDIISTSKDNVNIKPAKGKVTVASGVKLSKGEKAILSKIAKDSGVAVVVERFSGADSASKGFYSGGIVHLNADRLSEGGFTYTGIHEVVHHLRVVNAEGYKSIESFVKNYYKEKGADLDSEIAKTQAFYKSKGIELTPEEAMEEIVCNTLSDIATDEDALSAFLGLDSKSQNKLIEVIKTLVRKLKEWANKFLKNTEYHSIVMNDADTLLSLAKQLRAELTKSKQKNNTAENGGVKYAFGGTKADKAPSLYLKAERMSENGVDNETIRQETGWFKGYDGLWRFEIDDSEMKVALNGKYSRDPQIRRYTELTDKVYFQNDYTQSEFNELQELDKKLENKSVEPKMLGDLIEHKKLFEAYPQLQEISVVYESGIGNTRGAYNSVFNEIVLNNNLRFNPEQFKKTLVHEIQHAIQHIEGFAYGSSTEYWESAKHRYTAKEKERAEQLKWDIYNIERAVKKEFGSEAWNNIVKYKTLEGIYFEEDIDAESLEKQLEDIENEAKEQGYNEWFDKYYYAKSELDSIDRRVESRKHRSNTDLYLNTAGEIEARDVSNRVDLTKEQRENTQPDINRKDVVFAGETINFNAEINTDYSDLTQLDEESRKVYNDRGWAKSLFEGIEYGYLLGEYTNLITSKNSKHSLLDGTKVIKVNNKIAFMNGSVEDPIIEAVFAFNAESENDTDEIEREIFNGKFLNNKSFSDVERMYELFELVYRDGFIRIYERSDYKYSKGSTKYKGRATLPNDWHSFGYTKSEQDRAGASGNTQKGVPGTVQIAKNKKSYSFGDEEYLSTVESGDMATAQRLVDEAAEKAMKNSKIRDESGKLAKVYHGSESDDFYEFDKARRGQTDTVSGKDNKKAVFSRPPTL